MQAADGAEHPQLRQPSGELAGQRVTPPPVVAAASLNVPLASIQVLVDTAWTAGLVLLAGQIGAVWHRAAVRQRIERVLGAILIALGLGLALDRQ